MVNTFLKLSVLFAGIVTCSMHYVCYCFWGLLLFLYSFVLFFLDQIANDWQESRKSGRMLIYFPHFSPILSEISACNILMLWHKYAWSESSYIYTLVVYVMVISM